MTSTRGRDALVGAAAGLVGGLAFGWALQVNDMMADSLGLIGLTTLGGGVVRHFLVSALVGAGFGAIFGHPGESFAGTISSGILYGLLWWVLGPLTLAPLLMGRWPTWALSEAGAAFFNVVGHALYGGVLGLSFHGLSTAYMRWRPLGAGERRASPPPARHIVILGGGFAGVSAAQRLAQLTARDRSIEVTLVSQSNYLLFTPMLAEVASSALQAQHISAPIRAASPRTRFLRAAVEVIDTESQTVRVYAGHNLPSETLDYDHMVVALGSIPDYRGLPGLEEHAFTLKTLEDATRLRNHVISLLERADVEPDPEERRRQLTFVVAGGGFAGTETVAELFDLAHSVLRYYPRIDSSELRFMLVHSRDRILPELSRALGVYSRGKLEDRGIQCVLNARVAEATPEAVTLQDGRVIDARTLVWTAGNRPNPLLATLPYELSPRGAIIADETMRVVGIDNIWAVGDCAQIPDVHGEGEFCPPTAQHALRQGKVVAENIVAVLKGRTPKPFRFRTLGLLVALGHRTGAAEIQGRRFSGLLAWLLWRSVYLSKLPGLEKKVRVLLDWTIDLFFPRDIVLTVDTSVPLRSGPDGTEADSDFQI
jgi:NADH dehydrogenase